MSHLSKSTLTLLSIVGMLCASGCQRAILFSTATQTGIELNTAEGGKQTANVGYQRFEGAVMPIVRDDGTLLPKAYPLLAAYAMDTGSLLLLKLDRPTTVRQVFASGRAAVQPKAAETVAKTFVRINRGDPGKVVGVLEDLFKRVDALPDAKAITLCKNPPVQDNAVLKQIVGNVDCDVVANARMATKRRMVMGDESNIPLWREAIEGLAADDGP